MKKLFFLTAFIVLTYGIGYSLEFTPSDPIPGVDVKLGKRPPPRGEIIAYGKTNQMGTYEFKNLKAGTYFVEFGIRENGIKSASLPIRIEGLQLAGRATQPAIGSAVNPTATRQVKKDPIVITKKVNSAEYGEVELAVTYQDNWIRMTIGTGGPQTKPGSKPK
ncbi:MAG: hypothetical protein ABIO44_13590 [Saprospiraceae bacterium]